MSLEKLGRIVELYYSTSDGRVNADALTLDKNGVLLDKFHSKDIQRSVLIASLASYTLANEHSINLPFGSLGENILIDYNPYGLNPGTRLSIGNLVLEISQNCTLCKSLTKIDSKLPKLLKNDRGIFAKVITAGIIHKNDDIYISHS